MAGMNPNRRYSIEFVRDMAEIAVKRATNLPNDQVNLKIDPELDYDQKNDVMLSAIEIKAGWISFELCETITGDDQTALIGYQPCWARGVPATSVSPPDVDIIEGPVFNDPSSAIEEGIIRCLRENLNNACNDALMYQDWLEEKKAQKAT